uniref:Uncharacterized protein n=1 Tax=Anguilla anguilla TaxID=7936 RepID=A0A0E9WUH1_ANGAN
MKSEQNISVTFTDGVFCSQSIFGLNIHILISFSYNIGLLSANVNTLCHSSIGFITQYTRVI